jgi:two-component system, NtrC family, sensor kinase
MGRKKTSIVNIGVIGGGAYAVEMMVKMIESSASCRPTTKIVAIAEKDPEAPGVALAGKLGMAVVNDYHELYKKKFKVDLIIVLVSKPEVLEDVIRTRPLHIRILSYEVFQFLWKDIGYVERELSKRNEEMTTILNHIQDFIVVMTPEMKIVEVNEAFLNQMGYEREQVIGQRCHEIFQKEDRRCHVDDMMCPLNDVIRNKKPSHRTDLIRVDREGRYRHMDVIICPIWERDGKISRFIEISRDITEMKHQQEEITRRLETMVEERTRALRETHKKLLHQDKMSSLGKLSASVVHEINNPIAGVLNLMTLMKRIVDEGPVLEKETALFRQYIDLSETELRRISRIISNLLAFARHSKTETKRLDLNRLIERTLIMNANLIKLNGIQADTQLDPNLPLLNGSEDQLQQVIMNFISNAIEAMENTERKQLTITTVFQRQENEIMLKLEDTGIGIPAEHFPKLFEPFFTTKKKGKGVGLGLSVAYGIIKKHGGRISVDSVLSQGTDFDIRLPLDHIQSDQEYQSFIDFSNMER